MTTSEKERFIRAMSVIIKLTREEDAEETVKAMVTAYSKRVGLCFNAAMKDLLGIIDQLQQASRQKGA